MNELQRIGRGITRNILFTVGLLIGGIFEFLNHRTLMLGFMKELYGELGAVAHTAAVLGALFLVVSIISTGLRHKYVVSWALAVITTIVSFAVYAHVWEVESTSTINMAIVILSGVLPLMVAYFTHEIGKDIPMEVEDPVEQMRAKAEQARAMQKVRDQFRDVMHEVEAAKLPPTPPPPPVQQTPADDYADYVLKHYINGKVPGKS